MTCADSLETLAKRIDDLRGHAEREKELLAFLDERAEIYKSRGTQDTERLRAYALSAIAETPYVGDVEEIILESLETGQNALMVAAAAKAVKHIQDPPSDTGALLIDAARRLATSDRKVWFDTISQAPRPDIEQTAIGELLDSYHSVEPVSQAAIDALKELQNDYGHYLSSVPSQKLTAMVADFEARLESAPPSCCGCSSTSTQPEASRDCPDIPFAIWDITVQNQFGHEQRFGDVIKARPSVLAFFYTRCLNPEKCARTIHQLAVLQDLTRGQGYNILAMSYDPAWDTPKRLEVYGEDRGFIFGEGASFIRTRDAWDAVIEGFDLCVGYGPTTVNRHQIDLFILDAQGQAVMRWPQRKWTAQEVYDALQNLHLDTEIRLSA